MRLTNDLFRDMRLIMRHVAPEVEQEPYIVWQHELPGLPEPCETAAYAQQQPCTATREALQAAGVWRGPAPVVSFVTPLVDRWEAYGRWLHELAHLLPFRSVSDVAYTPAELTESREQYAAWAHAGSHTIKDLPRWAPHHGRDFLRVACHMWYRALNVCHLDVPTRWVVHDEYDLSPLGEYIVALHPELKATDPATPFCEIVSQAAPDAFLEQFARDKETWLNREVKHADA